MLRRIVIALVILILLGGYLAWMNKKEEQHREHEEKVKRVVKLDFKKLKKITIKRPDSTVVLEKRGEYWWIVYPVEDYADKFSVSNIIDAFRDRKYEKIVTNNPKDLSIFQLDHPKYEITFETSDGKKVTLQIGRRLPTSSKIFYKYPESKTVYLVRTGFLYALRKKVNGYRSKKVFKIFFQKPATGSGAIVRIKVTQIGGDSYTLISKLKKKKYPEEVEKSGEAKEKNLVWFIRGKVNDIADSGNVGDLLRKIRDVTLADFVINEPSERDIKRYGLDHPQKKLEVFLDSGQKAVLLIGKETPKPKNEFYAMVVGYRPIFTIRKYDVEKLFPSVESLRSKKIADFFADEITGVAVRKFSKEVHLHRTKDWRWLDEKGVEHDPNEVYKFLTTLNGQYGSELIQSPDDKVEKKSIGFVKIYDKKGNKVVDFVIHQPVKIEDRGKVVWLEFPARGVYIKKHSSIGDLIPDSLFKSKKELEKEKEKEKGSKKEGEKK